MRGRVESRIELCEQSPPGAEVILLPSEEQAELGVPIPRLVIRRVCVECLPPGGLQHLLSSLPEQDESEALPDLRVIWIKPVRLLAVMVGFIQPAP
jgi:hypothetical protein